MQDFTIFETATGRPIKTGHALIESIDLAPGTSVVAYRVDIAAGEWINPASRKPMPAVQPTAEEKAATRRAAMSLTPRQLFIGLHRAGFITPAEAVDAAKTGAMPAALVSAISGLDPADAADVEITWARMGVAVRTDPLVSLLAAEVGASDAEIDDFFATYSEARANGKNALNG